jgi:peroxiredoxin Q/BCP
VERKAAVSVIILLRPADPQNWTVELNRENVSTGQPLAEAGLGKMDSTDVRLRILAETARAMAAGMTHAAFGRDVGTPVVLRAGDIAPDFILPASDGVTYRLSDFRGRKAVVIAWFPKAFTGGCTTECKSLTAFAPAISRGHVQCFAASVDTPRTNAEFAAALDLTCPILSDPGKDVARAYGVLGPSGFASRWTFYVGADGRILDIDTRVRASSHGRDVAARLTELGIS